MKNFLLIFSLSLIALIPLPALSSSAGSLSASSELCDGAQAPKESRKQEAPKEKESKIKALERAASAGDVEAMYHLSVLFEHGFDTIPADTILARSLLERAALGGYPPAQNYLGFSLWPAEKESALFWLRRAADAGDMKALNNLAFILLQSDSIPLSSGDSLSFRDSLDSEAAALLSRAAEARVPTAMASLADLYREGRGVQKDSLKAEQLYLDAVSAGLKDAEWKLFSMNRDRYLSFSPEKALYEGIRAAKGGAETVAFNLYRRAAVGEIPKAYTLLADAYSSAKGVDYNHALALEYYARGAFAGDPSAQFILAELLEIFPDALQGEEWKGKDWMNPELRGKDAQYWFSLAAEQGITNARDAIRALFSP